MQSFSSILLLISFLGVTQSNEQKPDPINLSGYWEGSLSLGAIKLRFSFHFSKNSDNSYSGKLNSLDESLENLSVESIRLEERKLTFEVPTSKATFSGKISDDNLSIRGSWKGGQTLPLTLKKVDKPTVLHRPQLPKKPYPYIEENLTIENSKAKIQLSCTLTKPKGDGPFPCTVLISGSGPQDRDESLVGHKPFLVIADHLTGHGIAVLRFDDRGVGKSTGKFAEATSEDFASDVTSIVEHLKTRKDIDPKKIGLMGHSEGGLIAPMIAAESKDIAFIVMLSGTGLPGSDVILTQNRTIMKQMKVPESSMETNVRFLKKMIPLIVSKASKEEFEAAEKEFIDGLSPLEQIALKIGGRANSNRDQAIIIAVVSLLPQARSASDTQESKMPRFSDQRGFGCTGLPQGQSGSHRESSSGRQQSGLHNQVSSGIESPFPTCKDRSSGRVRSHRRNLLSGGIEADYRVD
jgi:uncharacterized protein